MLALEKLFRTLTVTLKNALLNSPTEKVAAAKIIKEATNIEDVGDIIAIHLVDKAH